MQDQLRNLTSPEVDYRTLANISCALEHEKGLCVFDCLLILVDGTILLWHLQ